MAAAWIVSVRATRAWLADRGGSGPHRRLPVARTSSSAMNSGIPGQLLSHLMSLSTAGTTSPASEPIVVIRRMWALLPVTANLRRAGGLAHFMSEEAQNGMQEKAEQGIWPTKTPLGSCNTTSPDGKKVITVTRPWHPSSANFSSGGRPASIRSTNSHILGRLHLTPPRVGINCVLTRANQERRAPALVLELRHGDRPSRGRRAVAARCNSGRLLVHRLRRRIHQHIAVWPVSRLVRRNGAAGRLGRGIRHLRDGVFGRCHRHRLPLQSGFGALWGRRRKIARTIRPGPSGRGLTPFYSSTIMEI